MQSLVNISVWFVCLLTWK